MVATNALGAFVLRRVGSSPIWGTNKKIFDKTKTFSIIKIIIKQGSNTTKQKQ
jgi:hypothetical protein